MNLKTITIGGGNKFPFLFYPSLEIIIVYILKRNKNNIHYHVGNIPFIRRIFLDILLFLNFVPKNRLIYIGQTESIDFIKDIKNSLVISSLPLVGLLTIFKCWSFGIPVLIYNPEKFYINFESFIYNKNLQFKNLNDIENIIKFAEYKDNYQILVADTLKYFDYLKKDKTETYNLLVNRAKKMYKKRSNKKIALNLNFFLRVISIHFKFLYILIKLIYIFYSNYIDPIIKKITL